MPENKSNESEQKPTLRFFEKAIVMTHKLGEDLNKEVPELDAICVVYLWNVDGNLPPGSLISLRQPLSDKLIDRVLAGMSTYERTVVNTFIQQLQQVHQQQLQKQPKVEATADASKA